MPRKVRLQKRGAHAHPKKRHKARPGRSRDLRQKAAQAYGLPLAANLGLFKDLAAAQHV